MTQQAHGNAASPGRPSRLARLVRDIRDRLPRHASVTISRRLVAQANSARDAQRYLIAATLFEEALRFSPGNYRIHIQCGHMFKEAGDYNSAERHYLEARAIDGEDAELALQLGHFYKVAGQPDSAAEAYSRALALQPGWSEAAEELARVGSAAFEPIGDDDGTMRDRFVPELLPSGIADGAETLRSGVRIHRLGAARMRWAGRYQRVLRGVEAIRGTCTSATPLTELLLLVDGEVIRREVLQPSLSDAEGNAKYVFNLWHDFSGFAPGKRDVELRFVDRFGRTRSHRAALTIVPPAAAGELPYSDAFVPMTEVGDGSLEEAVAARPSMVRSAARSPLAGPPRSILVQRADQLGDLACSVPALRRLRSHYPQARLVGLLTAANADLARSLGLFDEVIVADFAEHPNERRRTMTRVAQEQLRRQLQPYAFDVAVDLGEGSGSRPLLLLSGAAFLYGFKDRESPWLSAGFELNGHDPVNGLENVAHSRKLVALIDGLASILDGVAEPAPRAEPGWPLLARFGIDAGERYILLHSGARLAFSRWPHFTALVELLLARTDLKLVLMGDDLDERIPAAGERLRIVTGLLDFDSFDALLGNAAVFVGNDSGPKHVAALRGAKVVSLHMARLNWDEWGQDFGGTIISRRVPCAGCAIHHQPEECGKNFACIRDIRPEEVLEAVLQQL